MERNRRASAKNIPAEALRESRKRRLLYAACLVMTIAVAAAAYWMAAAAVERFDWRIDLTETQVFELTETTKNLLASLEKEVTILCCSDEQNADANIVEVLRRYVSASPQIQVEYLDLAANPSLAETYDKKGIPLSEGGLLISSSGNDRFIEWNELYELSPYTDENGAQRYTITSLKAESQISSAIVAVTTQQTLTVTFTAGHSESPSEAFVALLERNNYTVSRSVLAVDGLDSNVQTVIIAGAKRDFSQDEIEILDNFMSRNGNLMVLRDPQTDSLPELDAYLRQWGLETGECLVLEPSRQMDSPLNIIPSFGVSMINVLFSAQSTYLVLPECRELILSNPNGCLTNTVLRSTADSYGKNRADMTTLVRADGDVSGPFTVAATSERAAADGKTQYVFLMACTKFYGQSWLETESLGNADFILQVLASFEGADSALNIPAKRLSAGSISISWAATVTFAAVFVVIIPIGLLTVGVFIFLRRRRT